MTNSALDFYSLLPSLYRMRDEERSGALRALLGILQEQADHIRHNVDDLYDDFFIETCAEWVVPYIGDLVANNPLYEVTSTRRADVARTLQYRHGKGTQRVLEQLARDVTGWSAHVVPFFELLEWTQNLNHLRLKVGSVDVRTFEVLDRFDGPFDTIAHTVDVRPPAQSSGWHNVHNAGFFLWRLFAHRLPLVEARPLTNAVGEHRFHLSPAGNPIALFHAPSEVREQTLTREADVEAPIRPAAFFTNIDAYYGAGASLFLTKDGSAIPASAICTMDLSNWTRPQAGMVAVDVQRGRITFATDEEPDDGVVATYTYGFSGNLGGGPYDRLATIVDETVHIHVPGDAATITDAIADALAGDPLRAVVTIDDSRTYDESLTIPIGHTALTIQSKSTQRPTIHGDINVTGGNGRNRLTLSGLLIAGGLRCEGILSELRIVHTTLIPGRRLDENGAPIESHLPSIFIAPSNTELAVTIERSITGAIEAPSEMLGITAKDSIIDSAARDGEALFAPALVSGVHNAMPLLSSPQRKLVVTIADLPPRTIALTNAPASLGEVATLMQSAIRALNDDADEQKETIVLATATTLVLLGGERTQIRVTDFPGDPTATELKLTTEARETLALFGGRRETIAISDATPRIAFRHDNEPLAQAVLGSTPTNLTEARDALASAITGASVLIADSRLIVISDAARVVLHPTSDDLTTVRELGLASVLPAITGPPLTLDEVTLLGAVDVRQLEASNCIFEERIRVQRRQTGCVRFSAVAPHSAAPRRFRCVDSEPAFTSRRYGDAAYAQLAIACPADIRSGADDGSEMGAFHFLMQPQRETNLRVRLSEYLPFGLDAALIFVT
ncbi:MAG TPA: hypothetical protein VGF48_08915 [Thermoanaerobaculia bacterium]|jgi:hypothetical protein